MQRRLFLCSGILLIKPELALPQTGASARIAILRDLVEAIGAAGEAISKLTAGFKDLVVTSASGYSYVAAERERDRLIDISRRTAVLIASQNVQVVQSLDEYLALRNPTENDWSRVLANVDFTLRSVRELLADVQQEKGEFVLQPAFLRLNSALSGRSSLLQKLMNMPAPMTVEEREVLQQANEKYKVLISNATQAVTELNDYVKSRK
jgi:hypothetical protein